MSATLLYGHDGQPLITGARAEPTMSEVDQVIEKTVRSRAVTMSSVWDRARGKPKPTAISDDTLRLMANRNEWIAAIVKTRQNQIAGVKWEISVREEDPSGAAAKVAKAVTKLLKRPNMHGSRPSSLSWRQWLGMWLEDILVLDRGCVEKERDGDGWIVALYNVDGATIRPNMDDRGGYHDDAYVQLVEGVVEARFGMEDLIVCMDNPQTDVKFYGYGFSPLEKLVTSVTADLHAAKFNSSYFQKGSVPEGMLDLGKDAVPEDVEAFRKYWAAEIQGNPWAFPIVGGTEAAQWLQWRDSNRDMQFMEYQDWLLQKLCAVYQISKQELGSIEDVNRSTADSQDSSNERKGITPLLELLKDTIDLEIIGEHGQGLGDYLEFKWEEQGETAEQINQKYQPMHSAGVATGGEWRDAHGMSPDGDPKATHGKEGLRMHLQGGTALPSKDDADLHGAAADRSREDEVADRDHERSQAMPGQPTATPWKPGSEDDDDLKAARAKHDEDSGIGPRNVGKTESGSTRLDVVKHDRNPALTDRSDALEDVWADATERLIAGLASIMGAGE